MHHHAIALVLVPILFIALPWLILHYITKWRTAALARSSDELELLAELHELARRLEQRMDTVERLVAADHPEFESGRLGRDPAPLSLRASHRPLASKEHHP